MFFFFFVHTVVCSYTRIFGLFGTAPSNSIHSKLFVRYICSEQFVQNIFSKWCVPQQFILTSEGACCWIYGNWGLFIPRASVFYFFLFLFFSRARLWLPKWFCFLVDSETQNIVPGRFRHTLDDAIRTIVSIKIVPRYGVLSDQHIGGGTQLVQQYGIQPMACSIIWMNGMRT